MGNAPTVIEDDTVPLGESRYDRSTRTIRVNPQHFGPVYLGDHAVGFFAPAICPYCQTPCPAHAIHCPTQAVA